MSVPVGLTVATVIHTVPTQLVATHVAALEVTS